MSRSGGKRSNTRNLFSKPFRNHGASKSAINLQNFKIGDLVDIQVNSSMQKGMPFKYYHGKTGKIFNISKNSFGVEIQKVIGNRKIIKKINVKPEHLKKSRSKIEFLEKIRIKDRIRRSQIDFKKKIFNFKKKSFLFNQKHFVTFTKIHIFEPEPFSVRI
jgi:large subunit ribosomal protein L21e